MTKETDQELLELAAKAAGIDLDWDVPPKSPPWRMTGEGEDRGPASQWNPLTDDGDALRLAVKLGLQIMFGYDRNGNVCSAYSEDDGFDYERIEDNNGDPFATTRRTIVRAAAEIGKSML